ncbi:MAG: membrane dipeptidase [Candidatus Malihini olakiniferum]
MSSGLTEAGLLLVKACDAKRIMVYVSHIDKKGFGRLNASAMHRWSSVTKAHALYAQARNLIAKQLDAIHESNGFVGVNFGTALLRVDGKKDHNATVEEIVHYVD